jgi:hypothetical protein
MTFQSIAPRSEPTATMAPPSAPAPLSAPPPGNGMVMVLPIVVLAFFALSIAAAVRTWRRGHKLLFAIGFLAPIAWWVGAFLRPPKNGEWI